MSYMAKVNETLRGETFELEHELGRQLEILERQEASYAAARPRARFAVAAHLTKTRAKIARLSAELAERDRHRRLADTLEARS